MLVIIIIINTTFKKIKSYFEYIGKNTNTTHQRVKIPTN
jgi:hypothetical protein